MENNIPGCAKCSFKMSDRLCKKKDGKSPAGCPTKNKQNLIKNCLDEYEKPEILEFARQASIQESDGYAGRELGYEHLRPQKTRMEETIEFSRKMKYQRLGLVFCVGLRKEARVVEKLLSSHGFVVISAICKVGRVSKETINIRDDQKLSPGNFETMCNPVMQALILNDEKTDFNILLGLCVGHDSLFIKYSEALCTVLAVKDRVLGHNPMSAIYNIDSYYRSLKS